MVAKKSPQPQGQKNTKNRFMHLIQPDAAGIDIGSREHFVCVPHDRDPQPVQHFGTFTKDLNALADWLERCHIRTVAMESTSIYWIPLYELLEERGFEVYLVNARHLKSVPGRKSDVKDCQWIQQLHTFGLLQASFHPASDIRQLRSYIRLRQMLIKDGSRKVLQMQKALDLMNIKLTTVVNDITGKTGLSIIRDIIRGERSPQKLASHRQRGCQNSEQSIAHSLEGHYQEEHLFALKVALESYDHYQEAVEACDQKIEGVLQQLMQNRSLSIDVTKPLKKERSSKRPFKISHLNHYMTTLCAEVDLSRVDGLSSSTALKLLSEIGTDMSKWPSEKHFGAWLGLAPGSKISGGKVLSSRTKLSNNRAAEILRLAANTLHHSQSALGAFLRRQKARLGAPKAITATAYKLARIVYALLKNGSAYQDPGEQAYEEQHKKRIIKNLTRKAQTLGLQLIPIECTA